LLSIQSETTERAHLQVNPPKRYPKIDIFSSSEHIQNSTNIDMFRDLASKQIEHLQLRKIPIKSDPAHIREARLGRSQRNPTHMDEWIMSFHERFADVLKWISASPGDPEPVPECRTLLAFLPFLLNAVCRRGRRRRTTFFFRWLWWEAKLSPELEGMGGG
jgi:hypothetical protein